VPLSPGANEPEHRLLPLVGQMHAHAPSNDEKHTPFSVTHGQARVGLLLRSNPGTHVPRGCVGRELLPLPELEPDEPLALGAGASVPGIWLPGSSYFPPHATKSAPRHSRAHAFDAKRAIAALGL
jgi:hypothetical protein